MNYRHAYHAGNFADVFKHCLMVGLFRSLQRKGAGFLFVDTHAGRGSYDLQGAASGSTLPREPEWPNGIGRLCSAGAPPAPVADYLRVARAFDLGRGGPGGEPRHYPGSPALAAALARPQDRLELWERQPDECAALRSEMAGRPRTAVHEADGYGALRACLPPAERRALVLIDPPFEAQGEWALIQGALSEGLSRFATGVYAVWHPVSERAGGGDFPSWAGGLGAPVLHVTLLGPPKVMGMRGCGVYVVNPPWQFEDEARLTAGFLSGAPYRAGEAQASIRWISPR
jgi:23S rRNA (adenine2030-N6)-methyltransferase